MTQVRGETLQRYLNRLGTKSGVKMNQGPVYLVVLLVAGNLAYLIGTVILSAVLGVAPETIFTGPMSEATHSLVSSWRAVGRLLFAVDVLTVVGFAVTLLSGGRR